MTTSPRPAARIALFGIALAAIAAAAPAAAQQRVGVNSAVNTEATGIPPNAPPRRLVVGQPVIFDEHITTDTAGQTQILFVDESSMSIGPNSDLVIDRFVYNPATGAGGMTANLARGVFRYIGGKLSKEPNAVSMTTPAATIGIRGAVILVDVTQAGRVEVVFEYGRGVTVTGRNGIAQTITRPGYEVVVAGPGASPSAPFPAPPGNTASILSALDGRPGAHGGVSVIPTDAMVTGSGLPREVSANLPASVAAAEGNRPPPPVVSVTVLEDRTNVNTVATQGTLPGAALPGAPASFGTLAGQFVSTNGSGTAHGFTAQGTPYSRGSLVNGTFSAVIDGFGMLQIPLVPGTASFGPGGTASPLGPVSGTSFLSADGSFFYASLTPVNQPGAREFLYGGRAVAPGFYRANATTQYFAFRIAPDAALGSAIPFIRTQTGGAFPNPAISPLLLATPADVPFAGAGTAGTRSLQAIFAVSGKGPQQSSVIVVATGNVLSGPDSGQPVLSGQIAGSYRAGGASPPVRIGSGLSTPRDGNGNSFYGGNTLAGFAVDQNGFNGATAPGLATETAYPNLAPAAGYGFTQAATRTAFPANPVTAPASPTQSGYFAGIMQQFGGPGATYAVTGTSAVTTDATDLRVAARFSGHNPFVPDSSGVSTVTVEFGGLSGPTHGRQGYIDPGRFAALESPTAPSRINGAPLVINGDPLQAARVYMVTAGTVPAPLPGGVSPCQCRYLQWGYWGGELDTANAAGTAPARADVGHINTWLSGTPTPPTDIQALAGANFTGTYNGAMTGAVSNNGAQYLASGNFTATYNFASRSGSLAVSNYDGISFGPVPFARAAGSGANYSFALPAATGFNGKINGSFYGPMAQETGGNFAFHGLPGTPAANYLTSGIFAGRR